MLSTPLSLTFSPKGEREMLSTPLSLTFSPKGERGVSYR